MIVQYQCRVDLLQTESTGRWILYILQKADFANCLKILNSSKPRHKVKEEVLKTPIGKNGEKNIKDKKEVDIKPREENNER